MLLLLLLQLLLGANVLAEQAATGEEERGKWRYQEQDNHSLDTTQRPDSLMHAWRC